MHTDQPKATGPWTWLQTETLYCIRAYFAPVTWIISEGVGFYGWVWRVTFGRMKP